MIAFLLAAILMVFIPWLATALLSPVPALGCFFGRVLDAGAALNALAGGQRIPVYASGALNNTKKERYNG